MKVAMKRPVVTVTDTYASGFVTRASAEAALAALRAHRPLDKEWQRQIDDESRRYAQFAKVLERHIARTWPKPSDQPQQALWLAERFGRKVFNAEVGYWHVVRPEKGWCEYYSRPLWA